MAYRIAKKKGGGNHIRSVEEITEAFERYGNDIYRLVYGMVDVRSYAEDIVQETFIQFCHCQHTFETESALKGWLCRVALNKASDQRRSAICKHEIPDDEATSNAADFWFNHCAHCKDGEEAAAEVIRNCLFHLPANLRSVILLVYVEQYSTKEAERSLA